MREGMKTNYLEYIVALELKELWGKAESEREKGSVFRGMKC